MKFMPLQAFRFQLYLAIIFRNLSTFSKKGDRRIK